MNKVELYFEVRFMKGNLGTQVTFSKIVHLPFLLTQGQIYRIRQDPTESYKEDNEYVIIRSGIYETDNGFMPFIVIENVWDHESWLEACSENSRDNTDSAWAKFVGNELRSLTENFLKLGWSQAN